MKTALMVNLINDERGSFDEYLQKYCRKLDFVRSIEHASRWKKYNTINLAVFRVENMSEDILKKVIHFKQRDTQYCVIICDKYEKSIIPKVNLHEGIYLISTDKKLGDEYGLIFKLIHDKPTSQKRWPRYPTQQKAQFSFLKDTHFNEIKLTDLSRLGAKFSYEKPSELIHRGDLLKLKVKVSEEATEHCIHGRVIWINFNNDEDNQEFGVEFLNKAQLAKAI